MTVFSLDPRLATDTLPVLDLQLSTVRLMNDARFPWLVLVPRRLGAVELFDLDPIDRSQLWDEVSIASRVLTAIARPKKLNVAAIGNIVTQLHVHVVARFENDAAWPKPVWGVGIAEPYNADAIHTMIASLNEAFHNAL